MRSGDESCAIIRVVVEIVLFSSDELIPLMFLFVCFAGFEKSKLAAKRDELSDLFHIFLSSLFFIIQLEHLAFTAFIPQDTVEKQMLFLFSLDDTAV